MLTFQRDTFAEVIQLKMAKRNTNCCSDSKILTDPINYRIPVGFFLELDKMILKFIWKNK